MDSRQPGDSGTKVDKTGANAASVVSEQANDFFGKACPAQPGPNELLVLSRNPRSNGCELQTYTSGNGSGADLDVLQLYKDLRPSVAYFKMHGVADGSVPRDPAGTPKEWGGTGVAVAKETNQCLVITDDHVAKGVPQQHVTPTSMEVVMANGKAYNGTVVTSDPAHDLALVKVDSGADTEQVCKPAAVTEQHVPTDAEVMTMGQPYTSHTIYTSTGRVMGVQKREDISNLIAPLPGEDPKREILNNVLPLREGFSGGAVFDKSGKAVGINDLQTSPFSSVATPIDRAMVDDLIAKRTDKAK